MIDLESPLWSNLTCSAGGNGEMAADLLKQIQQGNGTDDVYGELNFAGTRPKAIKAFDTEGWVIYCSSISKTLTPGLRIGWCASGRYQLKIEQLKMAMNLNTAPLPQLTIAAFLTNGGYDRHLRQLRRTFELQVDRMTQAIYDYFRPRNQADSTKGGIYPLVGVAGAI